MNKNAFFANNFDLMRLLAASQVAVIHAIGIMQVPVGQGLSGFMTVVYLFPGVPIFFLISGMLISRSYENNPNLREYFLNRFLRLYPGLLACVTLSFVLIYLSGYWLTTDADFYDLSLLYLAKTTILQFYNPDFMRAYGDGVLNGSLWTITVEMQFYLAVPLLYWLIAKLKLVNDNRILLGLIIIFFILNRVFAWLAEDYSGHVLYKLYGVSFIPWFYMFLTGVFIQRNFDKIYSLLKDKFLWMLGIYVVVAFSFKSLGAELGNNLNPILFLFMAALMFSFAYSYKDLSKRLLRRNDISYGIYIYHMPVMNFMIYNGLFKDIKYSLLALGITAAVALLSWKIIEKPSLGLKKHPLLGVKKKAI